MQLCSQRYRDYVAGKRQDATPVARLQLRHPTLGAWYTDVYSGSTVQIDATSDVRRRGHFVFSDPTERITETTFKDILFPGYVEAVPYAGVIWDDETEELFPQGVMRLGKPHATWNTEGFAVEVDGSDRSQKTRRDRFSAPFDVNPAQTIPDLIWDLYQAGSPVVGTRRIFMQSTQTAGVRHYERGDDRWAAMQALATDIGADLFFNEMGDLVLRPTPEPSDYAATFTYEDGQFGTIEEVTVDLDEEDIYNRWVVTSETTDPAAPVFQAAVQDLDPTSPTYVGEPAGNSPFGVNSYFLVSKTITSQAQALNTALSLQRKNAGRLEQVAATASIANWAQDADDVVKLRTRIATGPYVIDSIGGDITQPAAMALAFRKRKV